MKKIIIFVLLLIIANTQAQSTDSIAKMQQLNQLADESEYVFEGQLICKNLFTTLENKNTYNQSKYLVKKEIKGSFIIGDTVAIITLTKSTFTMEKDGKCGLNLSSHGGGGSNASGVFILFCKKKYIASRY
jgi:hypothetical protein